MSFGALKNPGPSQGSRGRPFWGRQKLRGEPWFPPPPDRHPRALALKLQALDAELVILGIYLGLQNGDLPLELDLDKAGALAYGAKVVKIGETAETRQAFVL